MRAGCVGEHHTLGDLAGESHHLLPQCRNDYGRELTDSLHGAKLFDESAGIAEWLADGDAHALVTRRVGNTNAQAEAAARHLMHESCALCEVQHSANVERCDRCAERDAVGVPAHRLALRHVAVHAGGVDTGVAAALDVAGDLQGETTATGYGDEGNGWQGHGGSPG